MHKAAAIIIGFSLFTLRSVAQVPAVDSPLPVIQFEPWRTVNEDDLLREYTLRFPSVVQTQYPENNVVPLRVFIPADAKAPTPVVMVLHYWGASDQRAEVAMANDLVRQGISAVLVALPYHLGRTPRGSRSGQLAVQPDPKALALTMTQAVLDVRRAIDWVQSRPEFDGKRIGIAGTSLGAVVSATAYGAEPRIGPAAFVVGGADIANILWNSSRVVTERDRMRRAGITEGKLREELVAVEPLTRLPRKEPGPTFVVGGRFDTVVPPEDTRKLINALPGGESLWLETGHYGGIFVQRRVQRLVAQFFRDSFDGKAFKAPTSIYAPTIRLGASVSTGNGFQLAVGLDLWRSRDDKFLATLLLSPRDLQAFIGFKLDRNLSAGGFVGLRHQGVGIFWSTVL